MPTTTATYDVDDNDQITVDVLVGDAQPGGSTIVLGTTTIRSGGDKMVGVPIGRGSDVRGKKVVVVSEVTDINPATDNTSIAVTLRGGAQPKTVTQSQAAKKNDIVSFVTVVSFT